MSAAFFFVVHRGKRPVFSCVPRPLCVACPSPDSRDVCSAVREVRTHTQEVGPMHVQWTRALARVSMLAALAGAALPLIAPSSVSAQVAVGSGFTYQGEIRNGTGTLAGPVDLKFRLYDHAVGAGQVAGTLEISQLNVTLTAGRL